MRNINDELINEIKDANDIVSVLAQYVSLIKKGKNYNCLCPFHNDSNPSMVVSQEKQIYKCFSCGAGGNVINFVMDFEKISFAQALKKLADMAQIEFDYQDPNNLPSASNEFQEYYHINDEAITLYQYLLKQPDASNAYDYLIARGLSLEIIDYFKIGYSPTNNLLSSLLQQKSLDSNKAVEIGLLRINNDKYLDNLSNRIIFPIINMQQKVVGYTARALGKDVQPKYINSIESKIFNKSNILFNINNAAAHIKKSKQVYIVEGPNDVIAFHKAGYLNCVCVMGTALSLDHLKLLKNLNVIDLFLAFDGDEAGLNATAKAAVLCDKLPFNTKYIDFNTLDPDDYLKENGFDAFHNNIKQARSIIQFQIDYNFKKINTNNYEEKKQFVLNSLQSLNHKLDQFDKEYYYNYLANLTGISFELINSLQSNVPKVKEHIPVVNVTRQINDIENATINVLYFMMNDYKYYEIFMDEVKTFLSPYYRKMLNTISAYYLNDHSFNIHKVDQYQSDTIIINDLIKILLTFDFEVYNNPQIFYDSVNTLKLEEKYVKISRLKEELKSLSNPIDQAKLSQEIIELNNYINQQKKNKFNI